MDVTKVESESADWIQPAWDRNHWWALGTL